MSQKFNEPEAKATNTSDHGIGSISHRIINSIKNGRNARTARKKEKITIIILDRVQ
jgi:hypothetical protein